jgi:hypothetical protein
MYNSMEWSWHLGGRGEVVGGGAYPRIVKAMLIRRSGPHPAIMATPAGGTAVH